MILDPLKDSGIVFSHSSSPSTFKKLKSVFYRGGSDYGSGRRKLH
jgi:hypothetical protein